MRRFAPVALFVALALAALGPVRNYDFFWHLATGRWIVEHRALPLADPFSIASDRHPWIHGEWLFEVIAYASHAMVGLSGMSIVVASAARAWITHAILAAIGINAHPSALLAGSSAARTSRRAAPASAAAMALLIEPVDWRAIAAPLQLLSFGDSGAFVNAEW